MTYVQQPTDFLHHAATSYDLSNAEAATGLTTASENTIKKTVSQVRHSCHGSSKNSTPTCDINDSQEMHNLRTVS